MRRRDVACLAKRNLGPVFAAELVCMACGERCVVQFKQAPEVFRCPSCNERAALREENQPYPLPPYQ